MCVCKTVFLLECIGGGNSGTFDRGAWCRDESIGGRNAAQKDTTAVRAGVLDTLAVQTLSPLGGRNFFADGKLRGVT